MVNRSTLTPDRILDSLQVATWLGVAQRTICLWAECGEIPAFKIGRQWKFSEVKVSEWVAAQEGKHGLGSHKDPQQ